MFRTLPRRPASSKRRGPRSRRALAWRRRQPVLRSIPRGVMRSASGTTDATAMGAAVHIVWRSHLAGAFTRSPSPCSGPRGCSRSSVPPSPSRPPPSFSPRPSLSCAAASSSPCSGRTRHVARGSRLRVRASYADGILTSLKSGRIRAVPMAPTSLHPRPSPPAPRCEPATTTSSASAASAALSAPRRSTAATSRLKRAALRHPRCHDLRHTFGTRTSRPPRSSRSRSG
jgi:hypothetical protein